MKSIIKYSSFLFILVFLASCKGDRFSNVLEIELPEQASILAVTCDIGSGDRVVAALVSQTLGALENPDFETFEEADVALYADGTIVGDFEYDVFQEKHYNYLDFSLSNNAGTVYRMEVSVPGFETVYAEQIMPSQVPVIDIEYTPKGTIDFEGYEQDEMVIEFQDPAGEENFYSFDARIFVEYRFAQDTTVYTNDYHLYIDTIDPLIEYGEDGEMVLNDRTFDGEKHKVRFFFQPFEDSFFVFEGEVLKATLIVELNSLTKDKYLYSKSLEAHRENRDNPFAEPVTVHHNFENGTGAFTLANSSVYLKEIVE